MTATRGGYNGMAKYNWGQQWLRWTTAPILDQPSSVRRKCNRLWKVYMNAGNVHRIAVFYGKHNQYVTWIDNSLSDEYTNATMVNVACSLRPVPPA